MSTTACDRRIDLSQTREQTAMLTSRIMGQSWDSVIMPTDLRVASERKRKTEQAQAQTEITILLVVVIIYLAMLVLLVADQSFSKATIEPIGRLAP